MSENKSYFWQYALAVLVAVAMFVYCGLHVHAAEGSFTHTHGDGCYQEKITDCNAYHSSSYQEEYQTRFCSVCATGTSHKLTSHLYRCSVQNDTWQPDGTCTCTVCGKSVGWANPPGKPHTYKVKKQICGLEEGEVTATISIQGDTAWTNQTVTLRASINQIKEDASSSGIALDWAGNQLVVSENGTYFVTASNSLGNTCQVSYEVTCIDKMAPTISGVSGDTATMTKKDISVSVTASDGESGLAENAFSTDGGSSWSESASFKVSEGADITLVVRDKAGNTASKVIKRSDFPYPKEPEKQPDPENDNGGGNTGGTGGGSGAPGDGNTGGGSGTPGGGNTGGGSGTPENGNTGENGGNAGESDKNTGNAGGDKKNPDSDKAGKDNNENNGDNRDEKQKDDESDDEKSGGQNEFGIYELKPDAFTLTWNQNQGKENRTKGLEDDSKNNQDTEDVPDGEMLQNDGGIWVGLAYFLKKNATVLLGGICVGVALFVLATMLWSYSVEVYCYDGGNSYRKLGLFFLKRNNGALELSLPEDTVDYKHTPRYRLVLKKTLVKKYKNQDLIVQTGEQKLTQSVEECMDFVL